MSFSSKWFVLLAGLWFLPVGALQAASVPRDVLKALVWVQCGDRQGSGTVINGEEGFVLTNAHVAVDTVQGQEIPPFCTVGFLGNTGDRAQTYYRASVDRFIYNEARNQDFAILRIGNHINGTGAPLSQPFPFLKTNEFSVAGEGLSLIGYSGKHEEYILREATISGFKDGFIQIQGATIMPGDSGGAGLDPNNRLIGIPTRVVTLTPITGGEPIITYELIDIRAVMIWLDTYGSNDHDRYFTHEDFNRYHQNAVFLEQSSLDCEYVVRTLVSPSVFCLMPNNTRFAFPNSETFLSWYPNFDSVIEMIPESIRAYSLVRNVTYKPGTLVKSKTNAKTYVVVDSFGTIRWIPTEAKAIQLWGPAWAGLVHDIPDEFFTNYRVGQPLEV